MRRAVRFTEPEEFLAELARDVELVDRRIVRVSFMTTPAAVAGVKAIQVVAAYEVSGQMVRFQRYTGDWWGKGFPDDAIDEADRMRQEVASAIEDLGLEVRNGLFEDAQGLVPR